MITKKYIKPPYNIKDERVLIDLYDRLGQQIDDIQNSLAVNGLTEENFESAFLASKYHDASPECDWDYINNDIYRHAQQILEKLEIQRQSVAMWIHFYRCRRDIATCPDDWDEFVAWDAKTDAEQYDLLGITING